jgi:hypothetical protein
MEKSKQKVGASANNSSELNKRVAAILKKLNLEPSDKNEDDEIDEDEKFLADDEFDKIMDGVDKKINNAIDGIASPREAARLKKRYSIDTELTDLHKLASKYYNGINFDIADNEDRIDELKEEMRNTDDHFDKDSLRKEINSLKRKNKRLGQIMDAKVALCNYNMFENDLETMRTTTIEDDVRELYRKYGSKGIEKLMQASEEMDEEAI